MENYFQAEGFNLDKVLDEFEQNEGELAPAESSLTIYLYITFVYHKYPGPACVSGPSLGWQMFEYSYYFWILL